MTQERKTLGKAGESAAVQYLKKAGYRIVETNWQTSIGEIDIIAEQEGVLVFVEVKTRSGTEYGSPIEAVNPAKQKKLVKLGRQFLKQKRITDRDCRFDVVGIWGPPEDPKQWKIELISDAFRG